MTSRKQPIPPGRNTSSDGDAEARDVAERCLKTRLRGVFRWLKRVRHQWQDDPEPVHQLRVATRRARVAVQLFASLLSPDELAWVERYLKRLRNKAGDARDWDVLLLRVTTPPLKGATSKKDRNRLQLCLQEQRRLAQSALQPETRKSKRQRLRVRSHRLLKHLSSRESKPGTTLLELAQAELRPLVEQFFAQARLGLGSIEQIHQIRIAGKHVRYAMEVFAHAFPSHFRDALYRTFCELQEKLGVVNDHATAIARLTSLLVDADEKLQTTLQTIITAEQTSMEQRVDKLRATWRPPVLDAIANQFAEHLTTPLSTAPVADINRPFLEPSDGTATDGTASDGTVSDGTVSDGTVSDGTVSGGTVSDGTG